MPPITRSTSFFGKITDTHIPDLTAGTRIPIPHVDLGPVGLPWDITDDTNLPGTDSFRDRLHMDEHGKHHGHKHHGKHHHHPPKQMVQIRGQSTWKTARGWKSDAAGTPTSARLRHAEKALVLVTILIFAAFFIWGAIYLVAKFCRRVFGAVRAKSSKRAYEVPVTNAAGTSNSRPRSGSVGSFHSTVELQPLAPMANVNVNAKGKSPWRWWNRVA